MISYFIFLQYFRVHQSDVRLRVIKMNFRSNFEMMLKNLLYFFTVLICRQMLKKWIAPRFFLSKKMCLKYDNSKTCGH